DLDDIFLLRIAQQVRPHDYLILGIILRLEYSEIEAIKSSNPHNSKVWVFLVLREWIQRQNENVNQKTVLAEALRDLGRMDLARKVKVDIKPATGQYLTTERSDVVQIGEDSNLTVQIIVDLKTRKTPVKL
ncbi:unnamed protein product, partial [Owenia fusiformis]